MKITDHNHDNYIITPEFNKLTAGNFAARLKQANLATESDIANFVKKTDFDNKLLGFNKVINSNKTKYVFVENKLNKLSVKVEAISTIGLTNDLINEYKILDEARRFSSGTLQKHLIYFSYKKYLRSVTNTSNFLS